MFPLTQRPPKTSSTSPTSTNHPSTAQLGGASRRQQQQQKQQEPQPQPDTTPVAAGLPLTRSLMLVIFSHLYSDMRDTGSAVAGPSDAARDIAAAALACRGFAAAARGAFHDLGNALAGNAAAGTGSSADGLCCGFGSDMTDRKRALILLQGGDTDTSGLLPFSWADWETLLSAPQTFTLPRVKQAAVSLQIKVCCIGARARPGVQTNFQPWLCFFGGGRCAYSKHLVCVCVIKTPLIRHLSSSNKTKTQQQPVGTKEELTASIFTALGLPGPTRLPVRAWRACMLERCVRISDEFLGGRFVPRALQLMAGTANQLAAFVAENGELDPYCPAAEGAPALDVSATLADARAALLARGVCTEGELYTLEAVLEGVISFVYGECE
jgi:hypothetical protein